jgi:hypothetical protein
VRLASYGLPLLKATGLTAIFRDAFVHAAAILCHGLMLSCEP